MSTLRNGFPDGCDRVTHADIKAATAAGDIKLLEIYASNLLCTLERVVVIAEAARTLAVKLDDATRPIDW